jgi:hypothetical protein
VAGFIPAIDVFKALIVAGKDVGARHKAGHGYSSSERTPD